MDATVLKAAKALVPYSSQALQSFESRRKKILNLISSRSCPEKGWPEEEIEVFIHELAMMDSNNFVGVSGMGERESRIASRIVARRHYSMGHGIGRSGDITEIQPKAAGSSLVGRLVNFMVLDLLQSLGAPSLKKCIVVPLATGMSLMLCLRTLHNMKPAAKYVLWTRVDQKSCFKCIIAAGLVPIIIENDVTEDGVQSLTVEIEEKIDNLGPSSIVCVLTTVSSFAPKVPDDLLTISKICKKFDIPHLVNNAYGIQCQTYLGLIEEASRHRVDLFVSSTDKNFMVPVGGSVICGFDTKMVEQVAEMYPGRGSGTPSMDLFITLLNLGKSGYLALLQERERLFEYMKSELSSVAEEFSCEVMHTPGNKLSIALMLHPLDSLPGKVFTEVGSMLFSRFVMGTRLVSPGIDKSISGFSFQNWGSHINKKFVGYLTASAAIGVSKSDIDSFIRNLKDVLTKVLKNTNPKVVFGAV